MNTLEVSVIKVISEPKLVINTEEGIAGYKVVVRAGNGYGGAKIRKLWFTHLKEAKEIKQGYLLGYE